jgi:DNA-directed RNA polymerase subunit RPC12/RpoP
MFNYNKNCVICKQDFIAHNKTKETCSKECQHINHNIKMASKMKEYRKQSKQLANFRCLICKQPFQDLASNKDLVCLGCQAKKQPIITTNDPNILMDNEGLILTTCTPISKD